MARRILMLTLAALSIFVALPRQASALFQVTLSWTAPGDDGWVGQAYQYDVRMATWPITEITELNFHYLNRVTGYLIPAAPGNKQTLVVTGLIPGRDYCFAIKTRDERGNWSKMSNIVRLSSTTLDVDPVATVALDFSLPHPNPARSQTRFQMTLPTPEQVQVEAFDLSGRRVRTLVQGEERAGARDLIWNLADDSGRRVPAGFYLVRAQIGDKAFTRRVSVVH